jgi:hypothetical protein
MVSLVGFLVSACFVTFDRYLLCCEQLADLFCIPTAADIEDLTYTIPEVPVPAGLFAVIGKALNEGDTISGQAEHLCCASVRAPEGFDE